MVSNTLTTGFFLNSYLLETACLDGVHVAVIQVVQGFFDVINDPVVGTLSDHTRTRWGRRRPWMLLGSMVLPVSYWLLFCESPFSNEDFKLFYYMFCFCGVSFGVTCMNISISALVPELTDDYDERTSLSSYRLAIGNLTAFGSLMVMTKMLSNYSAANKVAGYRDSALVVAIIMAILGSLVSRLSGRSS